MDDLREALRRMLESGDIFDGETRELLDRMMAEGKLDELIDKLMRADGARELHLRHAAGMGRRGSTKRTARWAMRRAGIAKTSALK